MASEDERPETPFVFEMAVRRSDLYLFRPGLAESVLDEGSVSDEEGQPPASKAAIEAMATVEIEQGECAICLAEWKLGGLAKEMPCKHSFHGNCINKWLGIHGSCPICSYTMPLDQVRDNEDEDEDEDDGDDDEQGRERTPDRFIGFNFSFHGVRRSRNY